VPASSSNPYVRDVGMVQRRQDPGFAVEARQAVGVSGEFGRQDFDRDLAPEPGVARAMHDPHAALANLGGDLAGADAGTRLKGHG
jgi:hypothetical protein